MLRFTGICWNIGSDGLVAIILALFLFAPSANWAILHGSGAARSPSVRVHPVAVRAAAGPPAFSSLGPTQTNKLHTRFLGLPPRRHSSPL
jgi:hypothetical protein